MKILLINLIILASILSVNAQDYAVITSKSSALTQVSITDLKRLYTGKSQMVNNVKVIPVNMSLDNPVSAKFIQDVTGSSVIDYKSFWMAEQVRGGSVAPKVIKSVDALIAYISENPEAIGYVEKSAKVDGMKILTVK